MGITRTAFLTSSAIVAALTAVPAFAQTDAPRSTTDVERAPNTPSEDIVVTAQKREQTLIDVPQAVSVISGATLERQQANTFEDYLNLIPGLQISEDTPGQTRLILRGLNTGGVASTVGVYEDETPFGSSNGLVNGAILAGDFDTFDIARIEVLKGPQGTLYGASSLGGVIKFVTNAPDLDHVSARARGGVETTKGGDISYYGNGVINLPLASTLAFRASGFYRNDGGWIDSVGTAGSRVRSNINDAKEYGGRAALLFKPSDNFSVQLNALLQNIDTDAPSVVESDPNTLQTLHGAPTQSIFVTPFRDVKYRVYNGTLNYDFGFATLTSASSYSTERQASRTDLTFQLSALINSIFATPNELYLAQNTNLEKFTQEVRLASKSGTVFDWLIGGYYSHERGLIFQEYQAVAPGTLTPIPTTAVPLLAAVNLNSRYDEIAGFANGTLHLGTHFDIDLGGRESHNVQGASQVNMGVLVPAGTLSQRSTESVFTYSVAPKFKIDDRAAIYGRVAKGFRPGGPNALAPGAPAGSQSYRSDSVISYEVGVKAETRDHTFGIDLAAYHIDWRNIQVIATQGAFNYNANGGRAQSDGVEATATLRPTAGLDFSVVGAFNNAFLKDSTAGPGGANPVGGFAGDKLPFTPKESVSVNGDYRWTLVGKTSAFVGGSLRFLSKQSGAFDLGYRTANGSQRQIPSYDVIDLRGGLDFGRFSVEGYVKNLSNEEGKLSTGSAGLYPAGAIATGIIRPRTIGLSLTAAY